MKITPTVAVARLSGSSGGITAASTKGVNYFRERVTPKNPNTAAQILVRTSMGSMNTLWRSMSATIKAYLNVLGSPQSLSGFNVFTKDNRAAEQAGTPLKPTSDSPYVPAVTNFAYDSQPTGTSLKVHWTAAAPTDYTKVALILRRTDLFAFEAEILTTLDTAAMYTFPVVVSGKTYHIYAAYYSTTLNKFGTWQRVVHVQT